jgi:hypothetical protein
MRRPFQHRWIVEIPYWPLWPGAVGPHAAPAIRPPIRRSLNAVGTAKGDLAVGERPLCRRPFGRLFDRFWPRLCDNSDAERLLKAEGV